MELELIKSELKFCNSEIFLLWQSYLEYKLLGVGIPSRYSEYLRNGIDRFGIDKFDVEMELSGIDKTELIPCLV